MKVFLYLLVLLLYSCTFSIKDDVIDFNNTKQKEVVSFLKFLNGNPRLSDTSYKLEYRVRSTDVLFYYMNNDSIGEEFTPEVIIPDNEKEFFPDVSLYNIYRYKRQDSSYFIVEFGAFRKGKKEIDMVVFDNNDSSKNNSRIKQILTEDEQLIFSDGKTYYYQYDWYNDNPYY
jgi:hypothetical protein